jgi:hypothetical protein
VSGYFLIISILVSIVASQVFAPPHFSTLGKQKSTLTAFLRASVKLGDSYLIKQAFADSLIAEYPVVFDSYIQANDWLKRLQSIESRSPQSRDVLVAIAVLYDHMGVWQRAEEYKDKAKMIDPMYNE